MSLLKTIRRNQQEVKFNRIVSYGCSFTAGSELADHLYIGYEITAEELDRLKRKHYKNPAIFFEKNTRLLEPKVIEAQGKLSWAGKIASKFGVPILNRARSGSSMQNIMFSVERDRFEGIIGEYDLILIGATSMDRWMYFKKEATPDEWPIPEIPIIGYPFGWPNQRFHDDFVKYVADDYFLFFNYYSILRYFDLLNQQLGSRVLVQFVHHTIEDYISYVQDRKLNERFMSMISSIKTFNSITAPDTCLGRLISWKEDEIHGFYHPYERYHEQLAQQIVTRLLNNE